MKAIAYICINASRVTEAALIHGLQAILAPLKQDFVVKFVPEIQLTLRSRMNILPYNLRSVAER